MNVEELKARLKELYKMLDFAVSETVRVRLKCNDAKSEYMAGMLREKTIVDVMQNIDVIIEDIEKRY